MALMIFPFIPASNLFFPVGFVVAERVLYTPSAGYCMLVALGWQRMHESYNGVQQKRAKSAKAALRVGLNAFVALMLIAFSFKTALRNYDWLMSL